MLDQGATAILLDVSIDALENFKKSLPEDFQTRTFLYDCDITQEIQIENVRADIEDHIGPITGLVNNAAINPSVENGNGIFSRLEDISYDDWKAQLDVGLFGALACSRVFAKSMLKLGKGSIVNIGSDFAIIAPNQELYEIEGLEKSKQPVKPVTYSVVKHALLGLTKYLATYWAQDGIRVNTLSPGGIENGQSEQFINKLTKQIPMGRMSSPTEYAGGLVFLLSDQSSFMTGATLVIDGGRSIW